jgi:hypothetical protein
MESRRRKSIVDVSVRQASLGLNENLQMLPPYQIGLEIQQLMGLCTKTALGI